MNIFKVFVISFISSYLLLHLLIPFLKQKFLVTPNSRSSHLKPIPSGGGIVFVLVYCLPWRERTRCVRHGRSLQRQRLDDGC